MTKIDLANIIHEKTGLKIKESAEILETILELMKSTLESGEDLKISGFGKFEVRQKMARRGRNPQTGDTMVIEARRILTFKPSMLLRRGLNLSVA